MLLESLYVSGDTKSLWNFQFLTSQNNSDDFLSEECQSGELMGETPIRITKKCQFNELFYGLSCILPIKDSVNLINRREKITLCCCRCLNIVTKLNSEVTSTGNEAHHPLAYVPRPTW